MVAPFVLILISLALAGFSVVRNGPFLSDLLLLSALMTIASLFLLLRAALGRRKLAARAAHKARQWILVDGSNVMHWKDETPQLSTVREVLRDLADRGFSPGVIFDANVGYKVTGHYQDDRELACLLDLPEERVLVVPKGTQADPYLLKTARDLAAQVVTNDQFRDWSKDYPEVRERGFLIKGGYRAGKLWIEDGLLAHNPLKQERV